MTENDDSIVNEFITESKEYLVQVEADLLLIEKDFVNYKLEAVHSIFRAIHSIKGASGFLGFTKVGELSHVMEGILSSLRNEEMKATPKMIEVLLKGVDLLNTMFDDLASSNQMDIQTVLKELHEIKPDTINNQIPNSPAQDSLKDSHCALEEEEDTRTYPKEHNLQYTLIYEAGAKPLNQKAIQQIKEELATVGTVLDCYSTGSLTLPGTMDYMICYATALELDMMELATGLPLTKIFKEEMAVDKEVNVQPKEKAVEVLPVEKPTVMNTSSKETQDKNAETVRINVKVLDKLISLAGELVLVRNQYMQAVKNESLEDLKALGHALDIVTTDMQESIMQTRMQPIGNVFNKLPRIVRDLSKKLNKQIDIELIGEDVEVDKTILQSVTDPLLHIVRNSCDHGLETADYRDAIGKPSVGKIKVSAAHEGGAILIVIEDDGKGVDIERVKKKAIEKNLRSEAEINSLSEKEIVNLILLPGFSTAEVVSDVSGRGVGMDVVRSSIASIGGVLDIDSKANKGTKISLRLPLTLAILPSVIVALNGFAYAIPQTQVEEIVAINEEELSLMGFADNQEVLTLREHLLPILRLKDIFDYQKPITLEAKISLSEKNSQALESLLHKKVVVLKARGHRYGLVIEHILGMEEIVVKPMHSKLKNIKLFAGATVRGDGKVSLILDAEGIASHANLNFETKEEDHLQQEALQEDENRYLVFQNFSQDYFAIPLEQIRRIERVNKNQIKKSNRLNYCNIDNQALLILNLDREVELKDIEEQEPFILLPQDSAFAFGLAFWKVEDIVNLNLSSIQEADIQQKIFWKEQVVQLVQFSDIQELYDESQADNILVLGGE